jgi:lysophospholipase L1-like esterase
MRTKILSFTALLLLFSFLGSSQPFINEVNYFKKLDSLQAPPKDPILFIGSSSFTNWKDVQDYFPAHTILNRAFGGSSLPHLILYAEDVIFRYNPKQIVIYCGENDLTGGPTINADSIFFRFQRLHTLIRSRLPKTPVVYVSMKPSPSRRKYLPTMQEGNAKIKAFISNQAHTKFVDVYSSMISNSGEINSSIFLSDSLHMNKKGYQLWQPLLEPFLEKPAINHFTLTDPRIRLIGRADYMPEAGPRVWASGAYLEFYFRGSECLLDITDEQRWGNHQNYISVIIDGLPARRLKLNGKRSRITLAKNLKPGMHHVIVCKDTESGIGYIQFNRVLCQELAPLKKAPLKKIEFIGNSITCGMGSDMTSIPCKTGQWYDQHNAWNSYGALTARALGAQWHLTSESGIGLLKSCCNKPFVMPAVFDKININLDSILWDFSKYQPDVVTIGLGQNDGLQDSATFCNTYLLFIKQIRSNYPKATIVLLNSPMADEALKNFLETSALALKKTFAAKGEKNIKNYTFKKRYIAGCDSHPSLEEHKEIADELTSFLRKELRWKK